MGSSKADNIIVDTSTSTSGTSTNYTYAYPNPIPEDKTVKDLNEAIKERKEKVFNDVAAYIKSDMDKEMAESLAKKMIIKFGLDVDQLRTDIVTEEI